MPSLVTQWLAERCPEVSPRDFYRGIFPAGSLEKRGVYEQGRYTAIAVEIAGGRVARHTVTDDLDKVDELAGRDGFCFMSPISYAGKSRTSDHARELYAVAIDLDGIADAGCLEVLGRQIEKGEELADAGLWWGLPRPTYMVSSGTGLHLYYVLERPVRLFPSAVPGLERLKRRLTWQAWTQGASTLSESVQYEPLWQAFRMPGTATKVPGTRAVAFRTGEPWTVERLGDHVPPEHRAGDLGYASRTSLAEARERWPEWYERRVVEGRPRGTWTCGRALYDWWLRRAPEVAVGHRYWFIMTLAVYAKKCAVSYEELVGDAVALVPRLDALGASREERFTIDDVMDACEAYSDAYMTYPRRVIEERTGLPMPVNKRNGRKQAQHMAYLNGLRRMRRDVLGEDEYGKSGRPKGSGTKADEIRAYARDHPEATHSAIARALGVSRPTVIKWLKGV